MEGLAGYRFTSQEAMADHIFILGLNSWHVNRILLPPRFDDG